MGNARDGTTRCGQPMIFQRNLSPQQCRSPLNSLFASSFCSQAVAVDPTVHFTFPLKAFLPVFSSHISCPGLRFSCKIHFLSILYRWVLGSRDIFARCSWLHFPNTASFNSDRFACGGALSPSSPLVLFRRINP
jgi:hypothetical protein